MSRSVAILGPQGAGKSSIAALFGEHRGYQRHGIADAIKHLANLAYRQLGKDETLTVDRYSGLTVITGRELLQDIGAALREVDRKFWLRVWRQDYFEIQRLGYGVVIDDVRLPEEVDYLRMVDPQIFVVRLTADHENSFGIWFSPGLNHALVGRLPNSQVLGGLAANHLALPRG